MGTIKDRKVKDLTEARLRRGGKNAEKNYTKKGHNDWGRDDAVVTH